MKRFCTIILTLAAAALGATQARASELIPFVGCSGNVQGSPVEAPTGKPLQTDFPPKIARRIALYDGLQGAVLAPRGWDCVGDHGTGSGTLYITPPLSGAGFAAGPLVLLTDYVGGTSGDCAIVALGGRYFPKLFPETIVRATAERCAITEDKFLPTYLNDMLTYRSDRLLEFMTPSNNLGLGTVARPELQRSPLRTYGLLVFNGSPDVEIGVDLLTIRLPPELDYLHTSILRFFERCVPVSRDSFPYHDRLPYVCESGGSEVSR